MMAIGMFTLTCGWLAARFPHLWGVAPILGAILCAACFLRPRELFVVGLGGILIRDLFIGLSPFTGVRLAGMGLVVLTMVALKVRPSLRSLGMGLLISSPIFHLTLAVGDWATGACAGFPRTPAGLLSSILSGLPYFQRSFAGDVLFAGIFLTAYGMFAARFLGLRGRAFSRAA